VKVILPVAGKGTRLLPLTRHVPKPLLRVAGRPVLDYVVDRLDGLDIEELIFITGHLKDQVEDYAGKRYGIPSRFVEQRVQDGTAGAVNLARPYIDGPLLIIFVDTVFDADLSVAATTDADGIIWVKEVEDYQRFGVVVTDADGNIERIVEKPSQPISKLANIGLYYVRDWETLFAGIERTLRGPQQQGEWFLTDAFQYMIDQGCRLRALEVQGWYDCGKVDTVLETNRVLLDRTPSAARLLEATWTQPVLVETGAKVVGSTLGPNVTVEAGAVVENSNLRDVIVGRNAVVRQATVEHSLIGEDSCVERLNLHNMVVAKDGMVEAS
jgi:glucose-1-phosphate thymidylyltransferase